MKRTELKRRTEPRRGEGPRRTGPPARTSPLRKGKGFAASTAQRVKIRQLVSIVSEQEGCDPAHLWPRAQGGCDDPGCVVPLTREEHRAFDNGELDLLPYLIKAGCMAEMQHAMEHAGGPRQLLERLTGKHWKPSEFRGVVNL